MCHGALPKRQKNTGPLMALGNLLRMWSFEATNFEKLNPLSASSCQAVSGLFLKNSAWRLVWDFWTMGKKRDGGPAIGTTSRIWNRDQIHLPLNWCGSGCIHSLLNLVFGQFNSLKKQAQLNPWIILDFKKPMHLHYTDSSTGVVVSFCSQPSCFVHGDVPPKPFLKREPAFL